MKDQKDIIKILHVDDDEDIRSIAELSLTLAPWAQAFHLSNGQEALEHVERISPDILLLDYLMPGLSGVETWHAIRQKESFKNIPTIFMTAKAEESFGLTLINSGAIGIITKPFDPLTLADQILNLVRGANIITKEKLN
jgi:DNA-binding response OmpR family regulator